MYFSLIVVSEVSVLSVCVELVFDSDFLEWLETKERVEKREGKSDRENHSKQRKKNPFAVFTDGHCAGIFLQCLTQASSLTSGPH